MEKNIKKAVWTVHDCDACGSASFRNLGEREYKVAGRTMDFITEFVDVCCENCGFVYERQRPDEAFLYDFYRDAHNRYDSQIDIRVDYDTEARIEPIEKYVSKGAKILEIGASTGHFCQSLRDIGYDAEGLDPLDQEGDDADVEKGFITKDTSVNEAEKYDAIVSYYVMEHVRDANEWIAELANFLKPGGHIFIEVPNYKTYPYNSLTFEHIFHFRPEHMALIMKKNGFDVLDGQDFKPSRYFGFVTIARKTGTRKIGESAEIITPDFNVDAVKAEAEYLYQKAKEIEGERQALAENISQNILTRRQKNPDSEVYFWGANDYATNIALKISDKENIYLLDNSETKIGTIHDGFTNAIQRPDDFEGEKHKIFVLCSPNWNVDIAQQIKAYDLASYEIIDGTKKKD
jgi:SAM-dependent methyltransferase